MGLFNFAREIGKHLFGKEAEASDRGRAGGQTKPTFQLASRALALGSLLLPAVGAQPAFAACGGVTFVAFVRAGLIDASEKGAIVAEAARSQCGR